MRRALSPHGLVAFVNEYVISGRATQAEGAIRLVLSLHDLETATDRWRRM